MSRTSVSQPTSISGSLILLAAMGLGLVGALGAGCQIAPAATVDHGAYMYSNYCSQCHGADGVGKESIGAPSIAGLPQYYVTEQLHKFRSGVRGAYYDDAEGLRMRPMALTLRTDTDVEAVAMFVASMKPMAPAPTLEGGNAETGKSLYATCNACHGPEGAGMEAVGSPPLTVQPDWYLVRQLGKFKSGVRGANAKDAKGGQMRPMAAGLADDQAMKDVVAYIQTLRK
ncbi:MAG: c-type cytochrome [Myxococcota bacterium]